MGKQTKRARKFSGKGGVKARLDKGTVTNKGKLKRKRKGDGNNDSRAKKAATNMGHEREEQQRKRDENDFVGKENLADMDLQSFFENFADEEQESGDDESVDSAEEDDEGEESSSEDDAEEVNEASEDEDDNMSGSDDDEDVDVAADRMRREMDKLERSDPEFHKFLSENEQSLLEFGGEDVDTQTDDQDETVENDDASPTRTQEGEKSAYTLVDAKLLTKLEQGAFKSHGLKSLRKLIAAYKAACHLSDANQDENRGEGSNKSGPKKYHIDSSETFDQLMVMCLTRCHEEFEYHLVGEEAGHSKKMRELDNDEDFQESDDEKKDNEPLTSKVLAKSKRWNDLNPMIQSFFKSTLNVLSEAKEPELLTFLLKALSKYVRFLTPFPKLAEALLKTLTALWSAPLDSSEDYQVVRLNAFFRIRQLALTQPFPFIENCLKKTYLAYANRAKFGTSSSVTSLLPTLTFMGNCVVELYSLDYHSSYQHAFVYTRQLALHLRSAIQKKTPEALQAVYCWQYVHCLKLWVAVITASCKQDLNDVAVGRADEVQLLRSLIFPLTQVIEGVVRLVPTTRHLPLRLHCVRFLQQLAAASEVFIPTTSILLEVLDAKEIGMKPKKIQGRSGTRGLQLALILKLPKDSPLRTSEQLEACISEVFLLLNREVDLYRYSAGFPEFSVAICQRLRKFSKETKNGRWRAYSKGCIDLCERSSAFVIKGRAKLGEAPKDVKRLEALKPSSEPSMGDRHDAAIAKEKRLEEVTRPATKSATTEEKVNVEEQKEERKTNKKQGRKKKREVNESDLANTQVLEVDDEVAEGVDWTDDDEEESSGKE